MDINDGGNAHGRIPNDSNEDVESLLAANDQTEMEEGDNISSGWPVNGMRRLHIGDADGNYALGRQDFLGEVYRDNVHDFRASYSGGHLNDFLNSNIHNAEGHDGSRKVTGPSFDNSGKYARFNHLPMLSEVLRISKILRRLMLESNRKTAVDLCKKLDAAVRNQSNATYICRSFEILFDNMITVLRQCPPECLVHASEILGIMGYINRYDFIVYKNHLTKSYANIKTIRKYLMIALRTTLSCDAVNLDLKMHSESLLSLLKEYLENAEVAENFMAISETICELSKHYQQSFERHFTDIVDIIIGWHLEAEQTASLKRHCARVLQQFAEYFLGELEFTLGLLGQFIEDIDACGQEIIAEDELMKSKQQTEARVGAFIGAFTSIIKAMASKCVGLNNFTASANILNDAKRVVNKVAKRCFHAVDSIGEETVTNLNEFYCVISTYDKSVENLCDLENIMELQLKHLSTFNENQVSSFLYMILNIVRQYRTQLPLSFVSLIMKKENAALQELKLGVGSKSYRLLLRTYHEILIIKNVPVLQEAYRHILKDINDNIGNLKTTQNSVCSVQTSELMLSFYLASLSALACQTSSIIGMYALNPSILELMVTNCQAANEVLWAKFPTLHQALLEVIIEHSSKNHNFRQSSRLLAQHQESPSSENFSTILHFLANQVRWYVSAKLLNWVVKLLEECQEYSNTLTKYDDFLQMCENIINLAQREPALCSTVLASILKYPQMPDYILSGVMDIALCVLQSSDDKLSSSYCQLLALLPLQICLSSGTDVHVFHKKKEKARELHHWHMITPSYNKLRPKYFKAFVETLEPNPNNNDSLYQNFVSKSTIYLHKEHMAEYLQSIRQNIHTRQSHLQYEAARYCVAQKLRTAYGKPQETFLAIEAIIMKYARLLSDKEVVPMSLRGINNAIGTQLNCHMLLGFLENLEKHIYNAAEGTAFAMLPAEKPAKTFFRVNVSTCGEWFKRIRTAVNLIALHCMTPELVIRNCETMLLNESITTNRGLLDRTVTSMVWALYACGESDTMLGLQAWLKAKHCNGYEWIQHVSDHTSGHLEKAAAGYLKTLNTENALNMDSFTKEFIQRQLTDCLYHITIWSDVSCMDDENSQMKFYLDAMDSIYNNSLNNQNTTHSKDRESVATALLEMTTWKDFTNHQMDPQIDTFSEYEVLRSLKSVCLAKALSAADDDALLHTVNNCVRQGLRAGLMNRHEPGANNNQLNELFLLNHVTNKLKQRSNISIANEDNELSSRLLSDTLSWSLAIGHNRREQNVSLLLNVAAKARMDGNLNYCQSLLERFFKWKDVDKPLSQIAVQLKSNELVLDYSDLDMIRGIEELAKHMQAQNTSSLDALELLSTCCYQIIQLQGYTTKPLQILPRPALSLLLTLSDWLTTNRLQTGSIASGKQLQNLQKLLPDISFCANADQGISNVLPPSEYGVGKLLNASIICNANSGEAWFAFGNWCYRWGKKLMEGSGSDQQAFDRKHLKLTNRNISAIREIMHEKLNDEHMDRLVELLNYHMIRAIDDDSLEGVCILGQNATELLENELRKFCDISTEQLSAIVCIWRQAQKRAYGFHEQATVAYFKYLAIQSSVPIAKQTSSSEAEDCTFVTATLRLLRLIMKHAIGLQDVLEEGFRNTPLRPWKVIVPQLFSRLNHHEPYVRRSVSDLLCRLAVNQPQLIIFPAVVGAQQELKNSDNADNQNQLTNCFVALLSTLSQQAADVVLQVQLLVKELRRITLLWEEHWIQSLGQLCAEYSHLFNALEAESKKPHDTETMATKYEIFQRHLLNDFKQIAAVTTNEPETNYERSFQERFKPHIELVLKELQKTRDATKPHEYWQKIRQLYNVFQQRPLRGNSSTIRISDISPVLANMRNTSIAMPGVDTYEKSSIYIKSVDSTVYILPSKTKPKRLSFIGSNGQSYTFLFKGQEDLHLDERIMQFLSISNTIMARSYGSKSKTDCFKAHHYSVIPLGSQSGLISWVENCTPLFAIYKKWQQREATLKQQQKERQSVNKSNDQVPQSPAVTNTLRPSELFYNKLTPLLAERNIKVSDPRRQWPMPVLKRVLRELCTETPSDLLSKEIWCYSTNSVEWRQSVRRYTMSLAVMSVIGYIIGLGDRHLDNILIKLGTGEIVHIDYNVCFEKGKSLRVPEKVPFRMSQNLKDALGLVGTEGPFRLACSHVLKNLRNERKTLLTLLEAFVYDPLVDWTVTDDGGTTISRGTSAHSAAVMITSVGATKELQLSPKDTYKIRKPDVDLSRQALALKIAEIKPAWLKYKNDFDLLLTNVKKHVESLLDLRQKMLQLEQERDNFTKQQAMVQELEALGSARGSHALNTVTLRYQAYKSDLDSFMKTKQMVEQTVKDLDLVLDTYFNTLLRPEEIRKIDLKSIDDCSASSINEFELFNDLSLENNWNHIYTQAKFTMHEMENTLLKTHRSAIECRDLLLFYAHVMRFYPRLKMQQNHLLKYKKEYADLVQSKEPTSNAYAYLTDATSYDSDTCQRYFETMTKILADIQVDVMAAKRNLDEFEGAEVLDNGQNAVALLNEFLDANPEHNHQLILMSVLRRIQKAHVACIVKERKLFANRDYFLLDQQLCFAQIVGRYFDHLKDTIHNIQCPKILHLMIDSLHSLCNLRTAFENLCEKMISIFITDGDYKRLDQQLSDVEYLKTYPEFDVAFKDADVLFTQAVVSLQTLQERLSYLQEVHPNSLIDKIMNCWNINISQYMIECRNELLGKLISNINAMTQSFKINNCDNVYDIRTIRQLINEMILSIEIKLFDGLLPYILQIVTMRISDLLTPSSDSVNNIELVESDKLCDNVFIVIHNEALVQNCEHQVEHQSMLLEHYRMVTTAFYWLNEQHLGDVASTHMLCLTSKQEFLSDLHNINQVMAVWNSTMTKIQLDLESHRNTVRQLLETSASSAVVYDKLLAFNEAVASTDQRYISFLHLTTHLTEFTAVLLQFEISRDDEPFEALVKQFKEMRDKLQYSEASITEVEQNLVQLLDPEGKIDQSWIENISDLLDEMIFATQKNLGDLEKDGSLMEGTLRGQGHKLQLIMDSPIRSELRQLLKMITKSSKQSIKSENGELFHYIREVQQTIKLQHIKLNELQAQMFSREFETHTLVEIRNKADELCSLCQKNNGRVGTLIEHFLNLDLDKKPPGRHESPSGGHNINNKDASILNSQVGVQKQNAYAVSVWKRIRMKLEGRDPDPNRRSSVAEQVDYIIAEATNEDNLASLYEGWTPWV